MQMIVKEDDIVPDDNDEEKKVLAACEDKAQFDVLYWRARLEHYRLGFTSIVIPDHTDTVSWTGFMQSTFGIAPYKEFKLVNIYTGKTTQRKRKTKYVIGSALEWLSQAEKQELICNAGSCGNDKKKDLRRLQSNRLKIWM